MFNQNMLEILNNLAILFPAFLVVFTGRGFFKALAAKLVGDDTAYKLGFVTINPLRHIDFTGFIAILFVLFVLGSLLSGYVSIYFLFIFVILLGARWSIPVPINSANFKNYSLGILVTALAGSFGIFLIALIFLYLMAYFPVNLVPYYVYTSFIIVMSTVMQLCIFFGVLDLIPIPPFDGGKLLRIIFPASLQYVVDWLERYSIFIFLAIFFLPGLSNYFFVIIHVLTYNIQNLLVSLVI